MLVPCLQTFEAAIREEAEAPAHLDSALAFMWVDRLHVYSMFVYTKSKMVCTNILAEQLMRHRAMFAVHEDKVCDQLQAAVSSAHAVSSSMCCHVVLCRHCWSHDSSLADTFTPIMVLCMQV